MTTTTIAQTILSQLGGNVFLAMAGARNVLDLGNGLRCKIGKNSKRVTHVEIVLDPDDTYTVKFLRVTRRGLQVETLSQHSDVYAEALRRLFESETGLYLSL